MSVETMTTYKRADGELIWDEYGWVAHTEFFDDECDPVEVVEEVWALQSRRTLLLGNLTTFCDDCDEDFEITTLDQQHLCPAHAEDRTAETGA